MTADRPTTVETINRLLGIDIWTVRSFRADVRIDFREDGSVIGVTLLNEHRPDRPTAMAEAEVERLREAVGRIADHLWSISADEAHLDVVGDLRAAPTARPGSEVTR